MAPATRSDVGEKINVLFCCLGECSVEKLAVW